MCAPVMIVAPPVTRVPMGTAARQGRLGPVLHVALPISRIGTVHSASGAWPITEQAKRALVKPRIIRSVIMSALLPHGHVVNVRRGLSGTTRPIRARIVWWITVKERGPVRILNNRYVITVVKGQRGRVENVLPGSGIR